MIVHGGDAWEVARNLGIPVSELLDFSANINPRGLPPGALERLARDASNPGILGLYPDPSALALRMALSAHLGVAPEAIVVGPGAEALLGPALGSLGEHRALVPIPAFGEYRRVCDQHNVAFVPFPLDRADAFRLPIDRFCEAIETGAVFLNNPHNPTGAALPAGHVRQILQAASAAKATLLLDEAFVDYAPSASLSHEAAGRAGVIVFRSLTKFYGCPALRVGYAIAHPDAARRIAALLPTWPISQLAIDTLAEAIQDREYAAASLHQNAVAREALAESLETLGLVVFPSAANYLLLELQPNMPAASQVRACMIANHRILIRNCDSYEGLDPGRYIRVAVRSESDNRRLIDALGEELFSKHSTPPEYSETRTA